MVSPGDALALWLIHRTSRGRHTTYGDFFQAAKQLDYAGEGWPLLRRFFAAGTVDLVPVANGSVALIAATPRITRSLVFEDVGLYSGRAALEWRDPSRAWYSERWTPPLVLAPLPADGLGVSDLAPVGPERVASLLSADLTRVNLVADARTGTVIERWEGPGKGWSQTASPPPEGLYRTLLPSRYGQRQRRHYFLHCRDTDGFREERDVLARSSLMWHAATCVLDIPSQELVSQSRHVAKPPDGQVEPLIDMEAAMGLPWEVARLAALACGAVPEMPSLSSGGSWWESGFPDRFERLPLAGVNLVLSSLGVPGLLTWRDLA